MENKQTCLYDRHVALGALMSPFAGYDMPIQYSGIAEEHRAVRQHCGVFDVSHMGEVTVRGPQAEAFVQHIFTNDVQGAADGQVFYGMMCREDGGTIDDLLVYRMGEGDYFLVVNAANTDKDWQWIEQQARSFNVEVAHVSEQYGQIAVQGPEAEAAVADVLGIDCRNMRFYTAKYMSAESGAQGRSIISRTGYTGEDGFEIYDTHAAIAALWDKLLAAGVQPCGLGCRDTLRFEAGLPLYGDELSEEISPVMAGLGMFCKLDKAGGFIGRDALLRQKTEGTARKVIGIELSDKAIPRHGYPVLSRDGEAVGLVTTGYHTITTDRSVCMALVDSSYATLGTPLSIQIRRKVFPGTVVKTRFYDKQYKKS